MYSSEGPCSAEREEQVLALRVGCARNEALGGDRDSLAGRLRLGIFHHRAGQQVVVGEALFDASP